MLRFEPTRSFFESYDSAVLRRLPNFPFIPIPIRAAASVVPLKIVSYCSDLMLVLYGCRETRRKAAPVTSSHPLNSKWYRYLDDADS